MASDAPQATGAPPRSRGAREFPTTHWSLVLNARSPADATVRTALEQLCGQYWFPIYAFIRRQGRTHHEAEDLTQGFFRHLIETNAVARARPERGRFRTFLLAAARNFLTNDWDRAQAAKRGGGLAPLPLDAARADARFTAEPVDPGLSPEQAFDRTWALGLVERALAELETEYAASGRGALFAALGPIVWGGGAVESLAETARQLGLNENALNVALHRLRRRLRERVEAEIAGTVADAAEIAEELRYLVATLREKVPAT